MKNKIKSITNHPGVNKYATNTGWLFIGNISRMLASLLVGVWVARYLGPNDYGILSYAASFLAIFSFLTTLGLDGIVVRELVNSPAKSNNILGSAFGLKLIGFLVLIIVLSTVLYFMDDGFLTKSIIFIFALSTLLQSFNVLDFYFQSLVESKYVALANLFSLIISSITKIILILSNAGLIYFAIVAVIDSFTLALGFIFFYQSRKFGDITKWHFKISVAKSLLRDSWPLILSGLMISIYMNIDQVMIKNILGTEDVGQYSAAVRISTVWYIVPTVICSSLFPAIINAKKINQELYYTRLQQLYNLMFWMALTIALPMTILSEWIVHILYGYEYNQASTVLMIHVWAGIFVFGGVAASRWILTENLQVYSNYFLVCGLICNIILNYVLIPIYGINGAAVATLVSQFVASFLAPSFFYKTRLQCIMLAKSFFFIRK